MTNDPRRLHPYAARALGLMAAIAAAGIALAWAWNSIAAGLLEAPRARFVHALAFELAFAALVWVAVASARLAAPRRDAVAGRGAE